MVAKRIGSPLKSVMSQVLQNFVPSSGLIAIDKTLASLGLRSRRGKSSANALPWVGAFSGSHPLFHSDSGVSVAVAFVRSQISGPGFGRSGGSSSGGPIHTCTPWMRPSDI